MAILWDDGRETVYSFRLLRKECPCATCRDMRRKAQEKPLGERMELRLVSDDAPSEDPVLSRVDWVGNYALKLTWDDGHDTGIYPFEYLLQLGGQEEA